MAKLAAISAVLLLTLAAPASAQHVIYNPGLLRPVLSQCQLPELRTGQSLHELWQQLWLAGRLRLARLLSAPLPPSLSPLLSARNPGASHPRPRSVQRTP
jgi:hypothetical protein